MPLSLQHFYYISMAFPLEGIADTSEIRFSVLYYFIIYAKSLSLERLSVICDSLCGERGESGEYGKREKYQT